MSSRNPRRDPMGLTGYLNKADREKGQKLLAQLAIDGFNGGNRLAAIGAARKIIGSSQLAQAYLQALRVNVVGHAAPMPTFSGVESEKDRKALKRVWHKWAEDPSVNGNMDLSELLRALITSMAVDGRVLALLRRHEEYTCGLAVLPLPRDWIADEGTNVPVGYMVDGSTVQGVNGVVRSDSGRITHYVLYGNPTPEEIIRERHYGTTTAGIAGIGQSYSKQAVPVDMVLDYFTARSADDYDGSVSHLMPMLRTLEEIQRMDAAMMQTMIFNSLQMGFITRDESSPTIESTLNADPDQLAPPTKFEAGRIETLPPGYDFKERDPGVPTPSMETYRKEMVKNAGAGLGLDHAAMSGDLEEVNFSSIRHGMLAAREYFRTLQRDMERKLLVPMLARLVDTARLHGELNITNVSRNSAVATDWRHKMPDWIDPVKDAQASLLAMQMGIESPQRLAMARGVDYEQVMKELAEAKKDFDDAGLVFPSPKEAASNGTMEDEDE